MQSLLITNNTNGNASDDFYGELPSNITFMILCTHARSESNLLSNNKTLS